MASKPTQRSLKFLRDAGWTVCIVEKYIKHPNMAFGKRIDAFGIGDLLACKPQTENTPVDDGLIALVQTTSGSNLSAHREKLLAVPALEIWKASGGIVLLHGWVKRGPRGKRKVWTLKEETL